MRNMGFYEIHRIQCKNLFLGITREILVGTVPNLFSSTVITDDTAELVILLVVRRRLSSVNNYIFNFFSRTATWNGFKFDMQVPWVVLAQICSFCVNILNFVFLVDILGHFWSKLIFLTSSPEPQLRMVSNLISKYLGLFSLRFIHFVSIS